MLIREANPGNEITVCVPDRFPAGSVAALWAASITPVGFERGKGTNHPDMCQRAVTNYQRAFGNYAIARNSSVDVGNKPPAAHAAAQSGRLRKVLYQ